MAWFIGIGLYLVFAHLVGKLLAGASYPDWDIELEEENDNQVVCEES